MLVTFADFTTIAFVVGSSWARRTRAPTATKKSILRRLSQARGRRRCDSCESTIFAGCSRHVLVTIACLGWRFYFCRQPCKPTVASLPFLPLFRVSLPAYVLERDTHSRSCGRTCSTWCAISWCGILSSSSYVRSVVISNCSSN